MITDPDTPSNGNARLGKVVKGLLALLISLLLLLVVALLIFRLWAGVRENQQRAEVAPASGRFVQAGDLELFIQEMGPVAGPKVLLIHGTGAWSEIWRVPMAALAHAGFRAIAVDMPPFGFSERPVTGDYSRQAQAQRIVALLDALQITEVILVGHSFGVGSTVEAALLTPERVRALVLVDGALNLQTQPQPPDKPSPFVGTFFALRPLRNAVIASTVTNPLLTKKLLQLMIYDPADATPAHILMLQQPLPLAASTDTVGDWLFSFLTVPETGLSSEPAAYQRLTMPVLLVWGERDTITPLAQGQHLQQLLPHAELVTLPDVGHIPHLEESEGFNTVLLNFLLVHCQRSFDGLTVGHRLRRDNYLN